MNWMQLTLRTACASLGISRCLIAAHQTDSFSPIHGAEHLPFRLRLELAHQNLQPTPTLHSFAAASWDGCWLILGGRTNGLHGMTGQSAFPTAAANTDVWVVDPAAQRTWHRSLQDAGLTPATVDFLSATNHGFVQEDTRLFIAGGYGFDRSANDYLTFSHFATIDVPGLIAWVRQSPEAPPPGTSIRTIQAPLFQVTGGALEKIDNSFLLVFGQNYPGRYRPNFNGTYTRQVRRFSLLGDPATPVLDPSSVYQSPPDDDFRRRDLNVVPVLRRDPETGRFIDELLALAGVFTPTTGVWTVPVTITAAGQPTQPDPLATTTFKQGLHHYHSAKTTLFDRVTGDTFILQFGGLSAWFFDPSTATWTSDPLVPFVHHLSCLVRSATGQIHQVLLPAEFPDLRSPAGARLFFGTNAEFLPAPGIPLLRPRIIDLAAIDGPRIIGHIYGGLVSDAPHNGSTRAAGEIFAVILEPTTGRPPNLDIARLTADQISLDWTIEEGVSYLLEHSPTLESWTELWPPPTTTPVILPTTSDTLDFFRLHGRSPASPTR
jgi:hypothetical protein